MSESDPLEAAARALAAHEFDRLREAWFRPEQREAFVDEAWRGNLPAVRAAIAVYLRAESGRRGGSILLQAMAVEVEDQP
jgi:hypothetical protein